MFDTTMPFTAVGFILAVFTGCVGCSSYVRVNMYSDLINMVGQGGGSDYCLKGNNISDGVVTSFAGKFKPLLLSQYSFSTLSAPCNDYDIAQNNLRQFNWSCFRTGSASASSPSDINWFFVDCLRYEIISVKCLKNSERDEILKTTCEDEQTKCMQFTTPGDQTHVCSRKFEIKRTVLDNAVKIVNDNAGFPSKWDTIAYICAVFILVTFIISVCVPAEKCKPSYSYEEDLGLRVPLEIYELYGQHYKPSMRRKVKEAFTKDPGSISYNMPYVSHQNNVAVIGNSDTGLSLHRQSVKSTMSTSSGVHVTFKDLDTTSFGKEDSSGERGPIDCDEQLLLSPTYFQKSSSVKKIMDDYGCKKNRNEPITRNTAEEHVVDVSEQFPGSSCNSWKSIKLAPGTSPAVSGVTITGILRVDYHGNTLKNAVPSQTERSSSPDANIKEDVDALATQSHVEKHTNPSDALNRTCLDEKLMQPKVKRHPVVDDGEHLHTEKQGHISSRRFSFC